MNFKSAFRTNSIYYFALQAANLAVIPVLTRVIEPDQLAAWFLWFNVVTLLSSLGALRYELAIVTAIDHLEAVSTLVGASLLTTGLSILVGGSILIWSQLTTTVTTEDLPLVVVCATSAGACGAIVQSVASWHLRAGRIALHTALLMTPPLLTAIFQILFAQLFPITAVWLVFGGLLGYAIPTCVGLCVLWFVDDQKFLGLSWGSIRGALWQNRRFPQYSLPFTIAALLRERAIYGVLGLLGEATSIALFGLSHRLVNLANALLSAPLRPVFFQFASRVGIERAKSYVNPLVRMFSWLIVPSWVAVLLWAPEFLGIAFGSEWVPAAPYLRILSVPFFIVAASGWLDRIYDVIREQSRLFVMEAIFSAITVITLMVTLLITRDPLYLTGAIATVYLLYGWVWLGVTYSRLQLPLRQLGHILACHLGASATVVFSFLISRTWFGSIGSILAVGLVIVIFTLYSLSAVKEHLRLLQQD